MIKEKELQKIARFAGMKVETRLWLSERMHRIEVRKANFVFVEGDLCDALYIVEDGSIKVFKSLDSGREITMDLFYHGDAIGEVALIDEGIFPASAVALEDSVLLKLPKADYETLLAERPDASTSIIRDLSVRLRTLNRRVKELGSGEVEQRLALVVLTVAERAHPDEKDVLICDLSRLELASLVGTRAETIIRTISRWYKEGVAIKSPIGLHVRKRALAKLLQEKYSESEA